MFIMISTLTTQHTRHSLSTDFAFDVRPLPGAPGTVNCDNKQPGRATALALLSYQGKGGRRQRGVVGPGYNYSRMGS